VIAIVVFLALVACVYIAAADKRAEERSRALVLSYLCIIVYGALVAFSGYNAGQLNKTLPNLRKHHCVQTTTLEYHIGESSRTNQDQLVKAQENSQCKGSIVIQYPGNPPKTITFK